MQYGKNVHVFSLKIHSDFLCEKDYNIFIVIELVNEVVLWKEKLISV